MKNEDSRSTHWDLMKETAKEVATLKEGSHDRLKAEFLEEFGRLPSSEVLDYFNDLLKSDIEKTRPEPSQKDTQSSPKRSSDAAINSETPSSSPEEAIIAPVSDIAANEDGRLTQEPSSEAVFAEKFAAKKEATVLRFRHSFEEAYGQEPSLEIVAHFLKMLAINKKEKEDDIAPPSIKEKPAKETFVEQFVKGPAPTVKTFREAFEKTYGSVPEGRWINQFLNALSKKIH